MHDSEIVEDPKGFIGNPFLLDRTLIISLLTIRLTAKQARVNGSMYTYSCEHTSRMYHGACICGIHFLHAFGCYGMSLAS